DGRPRPFWSSEARQRCQPPLCHHLALQRLGQIPQLEARPKNLQPHGALCWRTRSPPGLRQQAHSPRRRLNRRQWPWHPAHHRRMPAEQIQQRNPGMNRAAYEKPFADYLGIKNVIWLASGIMGDDTHGHVDDLTRFVSPDTVVTVVESDPNDANYEPLRENIRRLRAASTENGNPLSIVELPMPQPVVFAKRRLPASYANFYIANGLVLVPVFNDPNDRVALDILADLFPDREIVGIYSGDL